MANLGTFRINTAYEYVKVAEITGITFEAGTTYLLQAQNACYICESTIAPNDENLGFILTNNDVFSFTPSEGDLYIKTFGAGIVLNISN